MRKSGRLHTVARELGTSGSAMAKVLNVVAPRPTNSWTPSHVVYVDPMTDYLFWETVAKRASLNHE